MKKLFILTLLLSSFAAQAQQNRLLESSFWKTTPTVEVIKAEIVKGADPSQLTANSMDPVVMAINANAPAASVIYLLELPGNEVSKPTHDGRNYLHWATGRGNLEIIEYLIKKGSNLTLLDSHGATPLTAAAASGQQNTKIYDLFIANGDDLKKDLNHEGANALLLALANDKEFALTNYFISKGLSLNSTDAAGNNAFSYAARSGNIDLLKSVIQKGVKPNSDAFLMAAQAGRASLALYQYLESLNLKPAVVNKTGENILFALVRRPGQAELINYFISKGIDVNKTDEDGNNVLMSAAKVNRDTATLALLLPHIKNINQANALGATALSLAMKSNSPAVVSYLISKGGDVKVLDKKGNNLAYYLIESYAGQGGRGSANTAAIAAANRQTGRGPAPAAGSQRPEGGPGGSGRPGAPQSGAVATADFKAKMEILASKGLDVAAPQKDGNTLYHFAVAKYDPDFFIPLQPLGIDINAKNKEGLTALHKAALIARDDSMMKFLISIGAKKEIASSFGETAFDIASENETLKKNNVSLTFLK